MAIWTARNILDSIDEGKLRIAIAKDEAHAEAQRRIKEEMASNEAAWAPIIAKIKESIPEWAWEYLTHPNRMPTFYNDHCWMVLPATIDLQGMGQVFVYYWDGPPLFMPAEWYLSDDDEKWMVQPDNGRAETKYSLPGDPDFLIALAQAYDNALRIPELMAEAARRNETPEPPAKPAFSWLDKAELAVGKALDVGNESAIAYALIGILEQLQKVTTPLYDGSQHAIQTFDNS
jgi:hypothetical protein